VRVCCGWCAGAGGAWQVLLLGGTYFAAAEFLDVMQNVGAIDDLTSGERIILVLPVAVLDAIFILWIFTALSKTLALLQVRSATAHCRPHLLLGHQACRQGLGSAAGKGLPSTPALDRSLGSAEVSGRASSAQ